MNFLIYVFWLAASVGMAIAIDKLLSPSQVIYSIGIYFIFLIMFGIQKKTYVKKLFIHAWALSQLLTCVQSSNQFFTHYH